MSRFHFPLLILEFLGNKIVPSSQPVDQKSAHSALILTITQLHSVLYYFYFHCWVMKFKLVDMDDIVEGELRFLYHLDPWLRFKRKTTQQKVFSLPSRAEAAFSFPTLCFLHSHFLRCLFPPPSLLEQFHYYLDNIFYRKLQQQKDWTGFTPYTAFVFE